MKPETKPKPKLPKIPDAPDSRAPALAAVWWPVDRPKPYAKNPRRNDAAVEKVAASIREFGWAQPIVVDGDGVIIIGHTRLKAAKKLGLKTVPVLVRADLTPEQVAALRLADNKTAELAEWDEPLLAAELDALVGAVDMEQFGFDLSAPEDAYTGEPEHAGALAEQFGVPPFTVLATNREPMLSRVRAWVALGIRSEIGRGGDLLAIEGARERQAGYSRGGGLTYNCGGAGRLQRQFKKRIQTA